MKSYNEMANNVFERRDAYLLRKQKIKTSVIRYGTSLLCFIIVIAVAFFAGYHQGALPSSNSSSSNTSPIPSSQVTQDTIWVPNLPYLDKDTLQGANSDTEDTPVDPWFSNFDDFENWLITGNLANNIPDFLKYKNHYLAKWVYLWQNADYTLKTGYYYRPIMKNSAMDFGRIDVQSYESGYRIYYRYLVNHTTPCDDFNAYKLNIFVNDSSRIQKDFQKEYNASQQKGSQTIYNKIISNQITYHIFIGDSGTQKCNFIGIYWEQNDNWYYAYYLASKQDPNGYKAVIQNLNMTKTPFRDDLKQP